VINATTLEITEELLLRYRRRIDELDAQVRFLESGGPRPERMDYCEMCGKREDDRTCRCSGLPRHKS
jgi:hypothetical protein